MIIDFSQTYKPHAKQQQAHASRARYLLFGGAMGGGKSWFLCAEAILHAMRFPGNSLVIVRKNMTVAKRTIVITFFSVCPPQIIQSFNQNSMTVKFINGSILRFIEANISTDPLLNKIKGLEIGWAGIDEANEVHENVFAILKTRLRWVLPDKSKPLYRIRLTSNPENCWLVPTFIERNDPNHIFVQSLTTDNYDENSEYVEQLKDAYKYNPELLERYLGGVWQFGSSIDQLIRQELLQLFEIAREWIEGNYEEVLCSMGVDVARYGDDRTCFVVYRGNDLIYVETWSTTSIPQVATRTLALMEKFGIFAWKVGVDVIGLGAGVVDILHEQQIEVLPITAGAAPEIDIHSTEFKHLAPFNLRSQMFMAMRNDIGDGTIGGLGSCEFWHDGKRMGYEMVMETKKELSWIRYTVSSDRKMQIIGKDRIKKEFGKSPDIADGLAMGNWMRRRRYVQYVALF
jgi:phage terminase large subunit